MSKLFRSVNKYFFGEEVVAVSSVVAFYGFAVVAVLFCIFCLSHIIIN